MKTQDILNAVSDMDKEICEVTSHIICSDEQRDSDDFLQGEYPHVMISRKYGLTDYSLVTKVINGVIHCESIEGDDIYYVDPADISIDETIMIYRAIFEKTDEL